jgi:predicted ribonuclease YlaK
VIVIPDTNLLLHTTQYFDDLDWPTALAISASVRLVIPMVVVDQIDSLKRSRQPVRDRARLTANKIESLLGKTPSERVVLRDDGRIETTVEVLADPLDHERLADSDSEIVDRASYLRDLTTVPLYVATWDNLMRFRAAVAGLEVIKPLPGYERQDESSDGGRRRQSGK